MFNVCDFERRIYTFQSHFFVSHMFPLHAFGIESFSLYMFVVLLPFLQSGGTARRYAERDDGSTIFCSCCRVQQKFILEMTALLSSALGHMSTSDERSRYAQEKFTCDIL